MTKISVSSLFPTVLRCLVTFSHRTALSWPSSGCAIQGYKNDNYSVWPINEVFRRTKYKLSKGWKLRRLALMLYSLLLVWLYQRSSRNTTDPYVMIFCMFHSFCLIKITMSRADWNHILICLQRSKSFVFSHFQWIVFNENSETSFQSTL